MNINVYIERLILDGLPIAHRERPMLQAAVEAELARLLTNDGLAPGLQTGAMVPHIPGGSIQLTADGNPGVLGEQIAQAVYGGIGGNSQ
ncbi:MAG: hypothetical protein NVSMB27_12890 [Ktedonobacteraceae bacterium]